MNEYEFINFVGAPFAGKTTLSKKFLEKIMFAYYSSGDHFRQIKDSPDENKTSIELIVTGLMKNKEYVSDDIAVNLFAEKIKNMTENSEYNPSTQYIITDGMPRTVPQISLVGKVGKIIATVYVDVSEDLDEMTSIALERLENSGRSRYDDTPEGVIKRTKQFFNLSLGMVKEYEKTGILYTIKNTGTLQEFESRAENLIQTILENAKKH